MRDHGGEYDDLLQLPIALTRLPSSILRRAAIGARVLDEGEEAIINTHVARAASGRERWRGVVAHHGGR